MIDLHTHSLLSDGVLLPSELARRAEEKGYIAMAITDHVDESNFDSVIASVSRFCNATNVSMKIKVIPGCEITHVPPQDIKTFARECRKLGAKIIVVHGETPVEPVKKGTNLAALESDIDILAHPGILTEQEAHLAAMKKIAIEITTRAGHSLGNGNVAKLWEKHRFPAVLNTDAHTPDNLITKEFAEMVLLCAGIPEKDISTIFSTSASIARRFFPEL
ncbi:MAG: histidinol phosphate phosphatase domain-containing protein [Candidatus Omnitrophica bacterium]|nr:histidinol phosphate phosphatase domain-containing protein [Candidatus Omnitrophota bacterium]